MPKQRYERRIDKVGTASTGGSVSVTGGGGGGGVTAHGDLSGLTNDDHSQYFNQSRGDARYPLLTNYNSHTADANAHHARQHSITSGSDHTVTGSAGELIGLTATNTIGIVTFSAGDNLTSSFGADTLTVNLDTPGTLSASSSNQATTAHTHAITAYSTSTGTSNPSSLLKTDANGWLTVSRLYSTNRVDTPMLTNASGDVLLTSASNILFDQPIVSDIDVGGAPSITLNPDTGLGDFEVIQANEAYFETIIAQAKRAEAGAIILSRSFAEVAAEMTVSAYASAGTTYDELIVNDFESLPGWEPIGGNSDDHVVALHFFEASGTAQGNASWTGYDTNDAEGSDSGTATVYVNHTFAGSTIGDAALSWDYSGASNSTTIGSDSTPATVQYQGSNKALFYNSGANNAHLHYNGTERASVEADSNGIVFTGRFYRKSTSEGVGLLVADRYITDATDEYVRIRCYTGGTSLHMSNHGYTGTSISGTTNSGYNPAANTWHKFRIEFDNAYTTASTTTIRARFWADGSSEPSTWQIEAEITDGTGSRPTGGTVGMWLYNNHSGVYYDDLKIESLTGTSAANADLELEHTANIAVGDIMYAIVTTVSTATLTAPSGWTSMSSATQSGVKTYVYRRTYAGSDPASWTWESNAQDAMSGAIITFGDASANANALTSGATIESIAPTASSSMADGDMYALVLVRMEADSNVSGITNTSSVTGFNSQFVDTAATYRMAVATRVSTKAETIQPTIYVDSGNYALLSIKFTAPASSSTAFALGKAFGLVELDADQTGLDDGQIRYTWRTLENSPGEGRTIPAGSIALDYGVPGDAFIEMTVIDQTGSPYIRFARLLDGGTTGEWYSGTVWNPTSRRPESRRVGQLGELKGLGAGFNSSGELGMTWRDADENKVIYSTYQMLLDGVDSQWRSNEDAYLTISNEYGIQIVLDPTDDNDIRAYTFENANGSVIGGLYAYNGDSYDSRNVTLKVNGPSTSSATTALYLTANGGSGATYSAEVYIEASNNNGAHAANISVVAADFEYDSAIDANAEKIWFTANTITLYAPQLDIDSSEINSWTDMTLQSGWTDPAGNAQYKRIGDMVYLRGTAQKSSSVSSGDTLAFLPAACYPAQTSYYLLRYGPSATLTVQITTGGEIKAQASAAATTNAVFDGVVFSTTA